MDENIEQEYNNGRDNMPLCHALNRLQSMAMTIAIKTQAFNIK